MAGMDTEPQKPLERAIKLAGGMKALADSLNARGHDIKYRSTVYQWTKSQVPAAYCPDIEDITGVRCEELRPDVNWAVLRKPA
jgi:DNA-binding transcriptional regulator YdaS (Cro superfamily)